MAGREPRPRALGQGQSWSPPQSMAFEALRSGGCCPPPHPAPVLQAVRAASFSRAQALHSHQAVWEFLTTHSSVRFPLFGFFLCCVIVLLGWNPPKASCHQAGALRMSYSPSHAFLTESEHITVLWGHLVMRYQSDPPEAVLGGFPPWLSDPRAAALVTQECM
jgi:hypothetical protein